MLGMVAEENALSAVFEHHLAQVRFFGGDVCDASILRKTSAGKEKYVRVEMTDKIRCVFAHIGGGIVQQQSARTIHAQTCSAQFLRSFEPIGYNGQRLKGL